MARRFLQPIFSGTGIEPVDGHVAHIRHVGRPTNLEEVLRKHHGFAPTDARTSAREVVPFIEQGLRFYEASRVAEPRIRPVLQYYAYLNLAVAVIRIYRPPNWQNHTNHGARDLTWKLSKVGVFSEVVQVRPGTITLFHAIVGDGPLPLGPLALKELLVPIPMVSVEVERAFAIKALNLDVAGSAIGIGKDGAQDAVSSYTLTVSDENRAAPSPKVRFPIRRIYQAFPLLKKDYVLHTRSDNHRQFVSRQRWPFSARDRAEDLHQQVALKLINFGGHMAFDDGRVHFHPALFTAG